jgi:hypothetical protein
MRCRSVQKQISRRADAAPLGGDLAAHLAACPDCRRFAAFCEALPGSLAQVPATAPGAGFVDRVMGRVQSERRPLLVPWRLADLLRPVPIGVAAAAFALGVFVTASSESATIGNDNGTDGDATEASVYEAGFGVETVDDALLELVQDQEG